ncbi:MAG: hypothetical protein ACRDJH_12220 [Thermomicrobiales bacterium]
MNQETPEHEEATPSAAGQIWPKLSILLIGAAALGLLALMCVVVALVAYSRG